MTKFAWYFLTSVLHWNHVSYVQGKHFKSAKLRKNNVKIKNLFISIAYNHYVVVYFPLIVFFDNHKKTHRVISGVKKTTFVSVSSSGLCFSISVTFSLSNVTRDSTHLSQTCLFADKSNVVNQSVFCYPPIFPKIFSVHDS